MNTALRANPVSVEASGVQVHAEPGRIRFDVSRLVEAHGDSFLSDLFHRALRFDAVDSVSVDRSQSAVTVEYDGSRSGLDEALQGIAGVLRGERAVRQPDLDVAVNFDTVAGSVVRVDRINRLAGDVMPVSGANHRLMNWVRSFTGGRKRRPSETEASGVQAVMHGLIVHYAPIEEAGGGSEECQILPIRDLTQHPLVPCELPERVSVPVATGLAKLVNLAAAGGCFFLSIVGFITPGIPAVPFVLATSYFLVRSTPELNERLRQSWCFGQFVRDWEDSGGLRRETKLRAIAFTVVLIGVTLPAVTSLPMMAMTATVATIDLLVVLRLPTIPDSTPPAMLEAV